MLQYFHYIFPVQYRNHTILNHCILVLQIIRINDWKWRLPEYQVGCIKSYHQDACAVVTNSSAVIIPKVTKQLSSHYSETFADIHSNMIKILNESIPIVSFDILLGFSYRSRRWWVKFDKKRIQHVKVRYCTFVRRNPINGILDRSFCWKKSFAKQKELGMINCGCVRLK